MQVKLKENSWHFRYYRTVTGNYSAPSSLCPYFWTLVLIVLCSPLILIVKLILMGLESLMEKVIAESDNGKSKKDTERKDWTEEDWNTHFEKKEAILRSRNKWNNILGKVFLGWIILCAFWIFGLGIYKVIVKHGWYYFMIHLLIGIGLVAAFVGLIWLLIEKSEKIGNWFRNLAIVNIIGGMISATYHKACPMIQWERTEEETTPQEEYEY